MSALSGTNQGGWTRQSAFSNLAAAKGDVASEQLEVYGLASGQEKRDCPTSPPKGCRFHTRCPYVMDECRQEPEPEFKDSGNGHYVACHLVH